jgi:hypothetical protein
MLRQPAFLGERTCTSWRDPSLFSLLLIAIGLTSAATLASEEPPVVRALLDSVGLEAMSRPTYGSLDVAADGTITLSDLEVTLPSDDDPLAATSYEVERLVLADVEEISPGLFEIGEAEWSHMRVTSGGDPVAAIPLITGKSVYIHQPSAEPTAFERMRAANMQAKEFVVPEAVMLIAGENILVEDLRTSWDGDPVSGAGTLQFATRRIHVPGVVFDDDDNPLAMAGYSDLELAVQGKTTSTISDDAFGFELELRIDGQDVGSLIIDLGADGIPLALFGAFEAAEAEPDTLLPFTEGMSFKRARIRFEDDSLTKRLLSLMADEEDADVDSFVADLSADVEVVLAEFLDNSLARQVSASVTAYLNDPKSITFAMAPKMPVGFEQIMAGLEDPLTLIELLQVSISAND